MSEKNGPITQKNSNGMQLIWLSTRDTTEVLLAGALVFLYTILQGRCENIKCVL